MKKTITILLFIICCILTTNLQAQTITTGTYGFSRQGYAPTDITTGNTLLIGPNSDNVASAVTDIGFTFWFAGTAYTQFSVNENGLLTLGSTQISGSDAVNSMASSTTLPKIAPYWDDLATGTNGSVYYKLTGTAPNRILIINWNVTVPKNTAGAANALIQLQLSETTGNISFTYGTPAIAANNGGYSAGIGVSATDFASITPTSATAATCAYGTAKDNNTISPGQYTRYAFFTDVAGPTITSTALTSTTSLANRTFTATIGDAKTGIPLTGDNVPRVYYKKNSDVNYVSTPGVLTAGTSTSGTWTFTIDYSLLNGGVSEHDAIYYFIIAQDQTYTRGNPNVSSLPTGVTAANVNSITTPPTTPNRYKIGAKLSGTVTVGAGGNYSSLTNVDGLFEDINIGILTGNLTVKIISDLANELGTNPLNAWANDAGGPFTITINPDGARTVSGSSALIKISGAKGLTIDGLNDGTNSLTLSCSYGPAVQFSASASSNTITKTTLIGGGSAVIYFYDVSGTFTKNCSDNRIDNCVITGTATIHPTAGIYFGSWTSSPGTNNVITNSIIKDFVQNGIHLDRNYANTTISNNQIYHTFAQSANYIYGIFMDLAVGATNIYNNKIYNLRAGTTNALNSAMMGIFYRSGGGGDFLNIYNNVISMDADFTNPAIYDFNAIELGGSGTSNVYYNSVYMGGTGVTSGNSSGLYKVGGTVNFKNNVVFNARSFNSVSQYNKNYAVRSTALTNFVSDNNLIYANGTSGVLAYVGPSNGVGGTDYATLSSWSTSTGKDQFSFSQNPGFVSNTDLTPNADDPNSYVLNGNGAPIPTVTTDMNNNTRNTAVTSGPTDIGAYEFSPSGTVTPNPAESAGTIAVGQTTSYYSGGKLAATITWTGGTALPTAVNVKYYSGVTAPGLTGTTNGVGYWEVTSDGTDFTYNITLYYNPSSIGGISSESNIIITKSDNGTWTPYASSSVNTTNKTVTLNGLNSFSYFALTDVNTLNVVRANVKVFLEGAYAGSGTTMINALNTSGLLPLTSETAYPAATFGYTAKTVASIPNTDIVDWVLVELRSATDAASKVAALPGFVKTDGTIVDVDGLNPINFDNVKPGNYYLVIRHRNHLAVMTASAIYMNAASALYDFTNSAAKAYGTNSMVDLGGGLFAMLAGDVNKSDIVTVSDAMQVIPELNLSTYSNSDINMSGIITSADLQKIVSNLNKNTNVPN